MSAYSDWKCGAIEEWQYRNECEFEERRDKYLEEQDLFDDEDDEE